MAKKTDSGITLTEMIKTLKIGELKHVYLFYGDENYLKDFFTKTVLTRFDTNADGIIRLDGKVTAGDIAEAAESSPLLMSSTVVIVRDSGLFKSGKTESDFSFLEELSEDSCIIFKESVVDARSSLFKLVSSCGIAYACNPQPEFEIVKILVHEANINNRSITQSAISLLFAGLGCDIYLLINEVDKLCMLVEEGGTIDERHVKYASELSIDAKIFDLTDGIAEKNKEKALLQLKALIDDKMAPQQILSAIANHFIKLNTVATLFSKGVTPREIAEKQGMYEFQVKKLISQSKGYTKKTIEKALSIISDTDVKGKNGGMDTLVGIELIIQEISGF